MRLAGQSSITTLLEIAVGFFALTLTLAQARTIIKAVATTTSTWRDAAKAVGAYVGGEVLDSDPNAWDRMLNLNVNAVFRTVHAVLPHVVEKAGDIIVTSSVAG